MSSTIAVLSFISGRKLPCAKSSSLNNSLILCRVKVPESISSLNCCFNAVLGKPRTSIVVACPCVPTCVPISLGKAKLTSLSAVTKLVTPRNTGCFSTESAIKEDKLSSRAEIPGYIDSSANEGALNLVKSTSPAAISLITFLDTTSSKPCSDKLVMSLSLITS